MGQCHEIFCFRLFSWIIFPQAPENNIRVISNVFENLQRYSQGKLCAPKNCHCCTVNDTGSKFAACVYYTYTKDANGKFSTRTAGFVDTGGK